MDRAVRQLNADLKVVEAIRDAGMREQARAAAELAYLTAVRDATP